MPEEDMAWARMKQLLDEEDDDPVVIPFFRRFGCLLLGLVAALILSIGDGCTIKKIAYRFQPANILHQRGIKPAMVNPSCLLVATNLFMQIRQQLLHRFHHPPP